MSDATSQQHLTLFFSTTGSLAAYERGGSYPAFLKRLRCYAEHFEQVSVCTFDTENYTSRWQFANVVHHPMPPLPAVSAVYHFLSPLLHRRSLRRTTVIRTFNITGAIPALILRLFTAAPIFVSYGYSLPDFIRFESGWLKYQAYRLVEWLALRFSDHIIYATPAQRTDLGPKYGAEKLVYLPNYVDVDQFRPRPDEGRDDYLLYVGRLAPQKNLPALFQALNRLAGEGLTRPLKIVGGGEELALLQAMAKELTLEVTFLGVIPNDRLPTLYRRAWGFVLPSHFEGMPKALLEAMACETPCLGADVRGIRDILTDETTGLVVPPTPEGLAAGLRRLHHKNDRERQALGRAGRQFVIEHFSMSRLLSQEISRLREAGR